MHNKFILVIFMDDDANKITKKLESSIFHFGPKIWVPVQLSLGGFFNYLFMIILIERS